MPNTMGHVRTRGPGFDNYLYMFDSTTGEIVTYSPPVGQEWGIDRARFRREDGDGQPTNVEELISSVDGEDLYRRFTATWDKIFDEVPEDCRSFRDYLDRVKRCDGSPSMCPACGRIAIGCRTCPTCGAFFGELCEGEGYGHLDGSALMCSDMSDVDLLANITKLLILARDGSVGVCEGGSGLAFWFPEIHFDGANGHRFKRILNVERFKEMVGVGRADWVEVASLISSDKFDEYIQFVIEYGKDLMTNREESYLIGDAKELGRLRKKYITTQAFRDTTGMCRFFFTKRTDYLEELSVPLYHAMNNRCFVVPTINHRGGIDWGLQALGQAITPEMVRFELLGIINDMMDDTSVDDIMLHVRSTFNA